MDQEPSAGMLHSRAPFGLTVDEVLRLPCLEGSRLAAGARGGGRRVRVVNIMEVPDIVRWMRGGELLLTTAYAVKDDASALVELVSALSGRGVAALGIKFGPYLSAPPDGMLELAERSGFPVIEIPPDVIFNSVLSEVLGTILNRQALELERSMEIHERLNQVMLEGGSVVELTKALSELVGLPAAIVDDRGRTIALAGSPPGGSADEVLQPVSTPIQVGEGRSSELRVWPGGRQLQAREVIAMAQAAAIAAVAFAQERAMLSREQRHRALFLMELTSGRPINRAEAVRRAAAMGWDLEVPRAVLLVDLSTEDGPIRVADQPIEERLLRETRRAAGGRSVVWGLQSGLAVLADPTPELGAVCSAIRSELRASHPGVRAMIGAGRVCGNPTELHRSYREAVEAVALGSQVYGHDFIARHEELGVYRLLCQLPESELKSHCDEALGALVAYDAAHHGSLMHTLEVYLRHRRNRAEAARELCIHYNTLRYRLELIDRLTGGLDRDPTSRLDMEIALHAERLLAARAGVLKTAPRHAIGVSHRDQV